VPAFKAEHIFRQHKVAMFSANFALYGDMSRRVMSILSSYSPRQEIYSIDESFLELDGIGEYARGYGFDIKRRVERWTGIPVSVGIAETKTLAKLANRIAKKFPNETGGCHVIDTEEKRLKALKWAPIEDVWGIGLRSAYKLKSIGVYRALDFAMMPESWVRKHMTIVGVRLQKELNGIRSIDLVGPEKNESFSVTRTFDRDYRKWDDIKERLVTFASIAANKLRNQQSLCRRISVLLQTNFYKDTEEPIYKTVEIRLPFPTSSTLEIVDFAITGLKKIYEPYRNYKRVGVTLYNFVDESEHQPYLFEDMNSDPLHKNLMKAMDSINEKYSYGSVRLASQDAKMFKMNQKHISRRYTTDINEILEVRIS
jgi:DNA polymerase V